jgi:DNA processing protein
MDRCLAAAVVLSAAGECGDHDLESRAAGIVGADRFEQVGRALAEPWLASDGRILRAGEPDWPMGLATLGPAAPVLLWVRGQLPVAPERLVAIVGSRRCTEYGRSVAADLARAVVRSDRLVVSGGARGIDQAAHHGALQAGGASVLFAAGGAGLVYPPEHAGLFRAVAGSGAVIWEHPPGTRLTKAGFLHRNRLIAACPAVTVVVEAAQRSGALNTGRSAADLGRLVLGVPGRIDSPASAGVHGAIADGWAALVLGPADLVDMLGRAD